VKTITTNFWRCYRPTWNFGEALVPLIINHFGYQWSVAPTPGTPTLLMIGSELRHNFVQQLTLQDRQPVVWGCGWSHGNPPRKVDARAVRGPITRDKLGLPKSTPLGDPGFLLPTVYPGQHQGGTGTLYAPHWHNRKLLARGVGELFFNVETTAFPVLANVKAKIDRLIQADFVFTSSLHVAIACIAYKVPFAPLIRGAEQINKPVKWQDVSAWFGSPLEFSDTDAAARSWWERVGQNIEVPDLSPLVKSFPHEIAD
jgi:hypothetical protein